MNGIHEKYINECFRLAKLGAGAVSPNPLVGAVIVKNGKIISSGYHERLLLKMLMKILRKQFSIAI